MSGMVYEIIKSQGGSLILFPYARLTKKHVGWINDGLARTASGARLEHAGHGRYDLVYRDQRVRVKVGSGARVQVEATA